MKRRIAREPEHEFSSPSRISNVNLTWESHMWILSPGQVSIILDYDECPWCTKTCTKRLARLHETHAYRPHASAYSRITLILHCERLFQRDYDALPVHPPHAHSTSHTTLSLRMHTHTHTITFITLRSPNTTSQTLQVSNSSGCAAIVRRRKSAWSLCPLTTPGVVRLGDVVG